MSKRIGINPFIADLRVIDLYAMLAKFMVGRLSGSEREAWETARKMMDEREKYVKEVTE